MPELPDKNPSPAQERLWIDVVSFFETADIKQETQFMALPFPIQLYLASSALAQNITALGDRLSLPIDAAPVIATAIKRFFISPNNKTPMLLAQEIGKQYQLPQEKIVLLQAELKTMIEKAGNPRAQS